MIWKCPIIWGEPSLHAVDLRVEVDVGKQDDVGGPGGMSSAMPISSLEVHGPGSLP